MHLVSRRRAGVQTRWRAGELEKAERAYTLALQLVDVEDKEAFRIALDDLHMIWERLSESYENDGYWPYPFILGCLRGEHDFDGQAKTTILPRLQRKGARRKALASLPGAARDGVISLRSTICALANPNCLIVSQGRSKVIQKLRAVDGNTVAMTEILRDFAVGQKERTEAKAAKEAQLHLARAQAEVFSHASKGSINGQLCMGSAWGATCSFARRR